MRKFFIIVVALVLFDSSRAFAGEPTVAQLMAQVYTAPAAKFISRQVKDGDEGFIVTYNHKGRRHTIDYKPRISLVNILVDVTQDPIIYWRADTSIGDMHGMWFLEGERLWALVEPGFIKDGNAYTYRHVTRSKSYLQTQHDAAIAGLRAILAATAADSPH